MVRLVVIDLDGTLLNGEHLIGDLTRQTLQRLHYQGVELMIATGRHFQDVYCLAKQLEVPVSLITSNGARVHSPEGQLLYENHIPETIAQDVLQISAGFDVHRNIYQGEKWWVEEPNLPLLEIHHASGFEYSIVDFDAIGHSHIDKFYFNAPHDNLVPLEEKLRSNLGEQLYITFTTEIYLEVMNLGVSKGMALSQLCSSKGIESKEVMAFGDGLNDIDMLQWAGHPVVMENAHPELKRTIPSAKMAPSNEQQGVAMYLQNCLF
ncbi:HAD family hydrolase [Thiomicrorhabdus indica]|uniref:HAD family hydrolase n=1 Tax=Thiomicrorhabdus indica TaxID=2267253 RepID=UPI002AA7029B|nr:HAD family hydrolase [Thiomicrorhabdus indica]